jgi:hypothetical protein
MHKSRVINLQNGRKIIHFLIIKKEFFIFFPLGE